MISLRNEALECECPGLLAYAPQRKSNVLRPATPDFLCRNDMALKGDICASCETPRMILLIIASC